MKKIAVFLAAAAVCAVCCVVCAEYVVKNKGTWPESWPKELEPLRKSSQTYLGGELELWSGETYVVPFTNRKDFEAAWPHILKVKSKGAPLVLVRSQNMWMGRIDAGVVIHCPPASKDPKAPIPEATSRYDMRKWRGMNYLELVVDGEIVDLNRIPLPADTPIMDQRF